MTERVTDKRLNTLAAYRYLADGTKIGVTDQYGNGFEYLGSLIYQRTPNGLEIESTDFAGGRILKTSAKYDLRYFVRDYLGSVRAIVDGKGQRLEAIDYMPYGSRWKDPMRLVTDNRYLFNGKEWQPTGELNVLDYGARHYDPELGRWFNPDPVMQFLNPYTFCGNDPVNLVDLNGMWSNQVGGWEYTDDPKEIEDFLNGEGPNGGMIDPNDKPGVETEYENIQNNPNGDGGGNKGIRYGNGQRKIMINGNWYRVNNMFSVLPYTGMWLTKYMFDKGETLYITEEFLAYLLSKGKLINPENMGDYWSATLDLYNSIQLGLTLGRCQVNYTIVNGVINIIYFYDEYNFDWKEWGERSRTAEILTRMGSYIPGTDFVTKYKPNIEVYE